MNLPSSNLYVTAEACQPALSHPSVYFEALPDTYGPATLAVNPVESSVYYNVQNGMSQLPTSIFHGSTVHTASISEAVEPLGAHVKIEPASLPKRDSVPAIDEEPKKAPLEIQSCQPFLQDMATISVSESVSLPSVPAATAPVAPATSKPQSKGEIAETISTSLASSRNIKCISAVFPVKNIQKFCIILRTFLILIKNKKSYLLLDIFRFLTCSTKLVSSDFSFLLQFVTKKGL
jgi:hypothetical protein